MNSEPDSFDELFRCHFQPLIWFLVKQGFSPEDARDAAADAMVSVCREWRPQHPRAWVYTTAIRIAQKKPQRDLLGIKKAIEAGWAGSRGDDLWLAAEVGDYAEVLALLAMLTETQRTAVVWRM